MDKWIAGAVGKMHVHGITQTELAEEIGVTRVFINKVLHGKEKGANMKERVTNALNKLIEAKKGGAE